MTLPITGAATEGKAVKLIAVALPFPVVTRAELEDKASSINDTNISGKAMGTWVCMDNGEGNAAYLLTPLGSAADDKWTSMVDGVEIEPV